ncbi:MAG: phosphatase PAP2 family protein [Bacillaceae bacterium]|nr:phosphatase PAP2 family protein [Bacillaceae bacterium]
MPRVTHLGSAAFTISLLLLVWLAGNLQYHPGLEGLVSLSVSHLFVQMIKRKISRPRPYMVHNHLHTISDPLKDYSFPSGHTTAIFSLSTTLSLSVPILATFLFPLSVLVGISRIYLGLHYPTDVGIGAMIGTITALLIHDI